MPWWRIIDTLTKQKYQSYMKLPSLIPFNVKEEAFEAAWQAFVTWTRQLWLKTKQLKLLWQSIFCLYLLLVVFFCLFVCLFVCFFGCSESNAQQPFQGEALKTGVCQSILKTFNNDNNKLQKVKHFHQFELQSW